MTIAFCGAHGVGKTTLTKAVAAMSNDGYGGHMNIIASGASKIFRDMELPLDRPLTFIERITVQRAILEDHIKNVQEAGSFSISDRTTLDMAAYMLGEWGTHGTPWQGEDVMHYVDDCFQAANRLYSSIVLLCPGIPYVASENRPPENIASVETFTYLAKSLLQDNRLIVPCFLISRSVTDLEERIGLVNNIWNTVYMKAVTDKVTASVH